MRKLLMIGALGAGLALAACAPTKPPPPPEGPHNHLYYTEVIVPAESASGSYAMDTRCELSDGTSSTHHDAFVHDAGVETVVKHTWDGPPYPRDCTVTETAGPPGTTASYWLGSVAPADYFGAPTVYVQVTDSTTEPQTCRQRIIGTYYPPVTPTIVDFWDCYFGVENT